MYDDAGQPPLRRPRLKDVAAACGVSLATASQALRGVGEVAEATRVRVTETARRMGYRANLSASVLGSHRKGRQAQLALAILQVDLQNNVYPVRQHVAGMMEMAGFLGFSVEEHLLHRAKELRPVLRMLRARGIDGIVTGYLDGLTPEWAKAPEWDFFSVVSCGRYLGDCRVDKVRPDIFSAVVEVWKRLRRLGYRRIAPAICSHDRDLVDDAERLAAVLYCQQADGDTIPKIKPWLGPINDPGAVDYIRQTSPDAVLSFSSGLYFQLTELGFKIPDQVGFAALHSSIDPQTGERLSGCRHNDQLLGRTAVSMIEESLRVRRFGLRHEPHERVIPAIIEEGFTLRSKPNESSPSP